MDIEKSSFRDRDGFIFYQDKVLFRIINNSYSVEYEKLIKNGLYDELINKKMLISHQEISLSNFKNLSDSVYKIIKPEYISFISYPYEWCFSQLKRAALLTLDIQLIALRYNMSLKDATAFNVQFHNGKAVFIDTLSFEEYIENTPWTAYQQFCKHFYAPLLLYKYNLADLTRLQSQFIDGIPLDICSKILPLRTCLNPSILAHIHLHSRAEKKYSQNLNVDVKKVILTKNKLISILNQLKDSISNIKISNQKTNWTNYYQEFSYDKDNIKEKVSFVENNLKKLEPQNFIDSGCNTGWFSILASKYCKNIISFDFDHSVIDNFSLKIREDKINNILPLVIDLTNPTPAIGWNNEERKSFIERLPKNSFTISLALIHHLAISNNIPFELIAQFYYQFSETLIIEFVPKDDYQTQKLLISRKDIFDDYNLDYFKNIFSKYFEVIEESKLSNSNRILFLMKRKQ